MCIAPCGRAGGRIEALLPYVCADPTRVPEETGGANEALVATRGTRPWIDRSISSSTRSLFFTCARRGYMHRALRRVRAPVLYLHGAADRLIPVAVARAAARRCPSWRVEILDGVGHAPQLEAADAVVARIETWLARQVSAAAANLRPVACNSQVPWRLATIDVTPKAYLNR